MAGKFSIYQLGNDGLRIYGGQPPITDDYTEVDIDFDKNRLIIRVIGTKIEEIAKVEGFLIEKV